MKSLTFAEALQEEPKTVQSIEEPNDAITGIDGFVNLVSFDLSGNANVTDFTFLKDLPKLEELYLRDMNLAEIPPEITALKNLRKLFIGENSITTFSVLKSLPNLVDIGLSSLSLRKVPDDILSIKKLETLGLANNDIASLTSLKVLTNLESLYVGSNRLKKVPKELKKLTKLKRLDLAGNWSLKDCDIVPELALEELHICTSGDMPHFPAGMFQMANLKRLEIYTHDRSAPDAMDNLGDHTLLNLEELSIKNSTLSSLPDSISTMKNLTHLTLVDNSELVNVDAIRELPELKTLNLKSNKIGKIGEGLSTLKKLEFLNLSHNELTDISGVRDLPLLRELHLYSNLTAFPETLKTLTAIENLQLSSDGAELSFLSDLENLTELYLASCVFQSLPKTLGKTVKKLTVYRDEGDDSYLQYFDVLEDLSVTQPSFSLPPMPALHTLSIGGIEKSIDFSNVAEAPLLRKLEIHRSESMKALPKELSNATQIQHIELVFLRALDDISALAPLENLETLKIEYSDLLTSLKTLGEKPNLSDINLYDVGCAELEILGSFDALECLTLTRLKLLSALPAGLSALPKLTKVYLKDIDELKDIEVLEKCASLVDFECKGRGPKRKAIAKVDAAIANRGGETTTLKTSYATFMSSMYQEMGGKEDASNTYEFPLWFDTAKTLIESIEDFSWIDDHLYGDDEELKAILTEPENGLRPLAILDWGYEGCNTDYIDAYSEEIFLVDTQSPMNPVLLWGHDSNPREIYKSFDAFLANLREFVLEGDDEQTSSVTRLEYIDEKSSKFWQIKIDGHTHTVTYGKIGTKGQTKEKTFADSESVEKAANKLIASKRKKGYVDAQL